MANTTVVNIYRSEYDVYIGRAGRGKDGYFGNPFPVGFDGMTRDQSIEKYKAYFFQRLETDSKFRDQVTELKGKVLGCFCKPKACHGDVIAEWINNNG